ncbi:PIN-like domain-containing protein [Brevundimonas sp. G8]|uniref:PIN-like domain-containing protein n=1 Tax=Brevundimonas sp. G8 TaxID=1350776 RepID=UPI00135678D3|nr:PIN-like domain-containing protein [Brevundimonas sp. G8]
MKEIFPSYYKLSNEDVSDIWSKGTFVLDANVLLNLYRYPLEARDDILRVLSAVKDRLWIPHHAALEFQRNRLSVISEQMKRYRDVRDIAKDIIKSVENGTEKLQLRQRHSSINIDSFILKLEPVISDFISTLDELERHQNDVHDHDQLRDMIDELCDGKVGSGLNREEYESISKEGKERFANKVPPGYLDIGKDKSANPSFSYNGVVMERQYGDLIVWKQIVSFAKGDQSKDIIYITDDTKEDWWWVVDSGGKKKIGPRPELVEELYTEAAGARLIMSTSLSLLKSASEYLSLEINQSSIDQVRDVTTINEFYKGDMYGKAFDAVRSWVKAENPFGLLDESYDDIDIIVFNESTGKKTAYHFYPVVNHDISLLHVTNRTRELLESCAEAGVEVAVFMLLMRSKELFDSLSEAIASGQSSPSQGVNIVVALGQDSTGDVFTIVDTRRFPERAVERLTF